MSGLKNGEWQYSHNSIYHLDRNYEIVTTIFRKELLYNEHVKELIALCNLYMKDAWSIACFESYDFFITIRSWDKDGLKQLVTNHSQYFKDTDE
jgi:hypothetical protein